MRILCLSLVLGFSIGAFGDHAAAWADGLADNDPTQARRVPKLGIEVPADQRAALEARLKELAEALAGLRQSTDASTAELLPDVEIFYKAVSDALTYQEFFEPREVDAAGELLSEGLSRAALLAEGRAPWATARGLVVRGYTSKLDGSAQPYGLVVPESYASEGSSRHRLDLWFHGRGETLSEVNFLASRRAQVGQFAPPDTIVLHPYGRYSNAFKFAGEVDVLEALDSVRRRYRIDEDRVSVRGFSMGGAACWQFAVHYADRWFAANPGAGFSETPEFLKFFQKETLNPTWYERKLWQMYDCTDWAGNLFHCPTVAYSGELDIQKQATDIMQEALAREQIDLVHLIGPQTAHSYHPDAQIETDRRLASLAARGRERVPRTVRFTTYTLKYNRMAWVTVDGLKEHWQKSTVDAQLSGFSNVKLQTANVTGLSLDMPPGWCPLDMRRRVRLEIDGQSLEAPQPRSDRSWSVQLRRAGDQWEVGSLDTTGLRKQHDLQGPIDDALMDSFIFVRPTGKTKPEVAAWADAELERAIEHWRRHFRGQARVKTDQEITDNDIASSNLVLWGDPASNAVLGRIAERLPIQWSSSQIVAGERRFPADGHALIAIYPNPLNARRYVVLNSSFTFREFAYLNNARQVAKLPDWAIVDLSSPPDSLWPGKIVAADFFDESWQVRPPRE